MLWKILWKFGKKQRHGSPKIKVGLVGLNGWGASYLKLLSESDIFELTACYSKTITDKIKIYCQKNFIQIAGSYDELLTNFDIAAIFIITPNHLHYPQCIQAINNGKHVFIEKPIANTANETKEICRLADEKNVIVGVGHNVRRRGEFRNIKSLLKRKDIGDIIMVEANNSQPVSDGRETGWRLKKLTCPTGVLSQLGIHHIDTFHYLFGEISEVKSILSTKQYDSEVPETVLSIFFFKSGIMGYLGTNYIGIPTFWMKIYGTKGNIILEDTTILLQKDNNCKKIRFKSINTLHEQIQEFGKCIVNNKKPEVGCAEALRNMEVIEAILKSAENSGEKVSV